MFEDLAFDMATFKKLTSVLMLILAFAFFFLTPSAEVRHDAPLSSQLLTLHRLRKARRSQERSISTCTKAIKS